MLRGLYTGGLGGFVQLTEQQQAGLLTHERATASPWEMRPKLRKQVTGLITQETPAPFFLPLLFIQSNGDAREYWCYDHRSRYRTSV